MKKTAMTALALILSLAGTELPAREASGVKAMGLAAPAAGADLVPYEYGLRRLGDDDVLIDVLYAGICHSDIEIVRDSFDVPVPYPYVPGHEIAGRVAETGKNVKTLKTGDYVAVGSMVDSCGTCEFCAAGQEQYCLRGAEWTGGGYATKIVVREKFVLKLPDGMDVSRAAPLLCAGITVYSPLRKLDLKKGDKIAVAGLGGLGHLAVKYAVSKGAEVTVFEITDSKIAAAEKLGAAEYVNLNADERAFEKHAGRFNAIIDAIPGRLALQPYLDMLKNTGTFVILGMPPAKDRMAEFDIHAMTGGGKKIMGSSIGGIKETAEMLEYSAEHGIYPDVEIIDAEYVNEAFRRVEAGDVLFRFVIDASTIKTRSAHADGDAE